MGLSKDLSCEVGSFSFCCPSPHGRFHSDLRLYFPRTGALGYAVCFAPLRLSQFIYARMWGRRVIPAALPAPFSATLSLALSVYLCANVGSQGLPVVRLPAPFLPHSTSLGPPWLCESSPPRMPVSAPPTGLDECLFFISLVSDFLAV